MASSLITGAVSLLLILIAGYVIATGILTIAETTIYTQTDVTYNQELIKQTAVSVDPLWDSEEKRLSLTLFNNGSTSFSTKDFLKMDVFTYDAVNKMQRYTYSDCEFIVNPTMDIINKGMWDPSEVLVVNISLAQTPEWVKFVTSNGITTAVNIE